MVKEGITVLYSRLKSQKYHIVGSHSAVKKCHWTHAALLERRFCYKCLFYGIETHRCVQMSPAVLWCWNRCLHCWRFRPSDAGIDFDDTRLPTVDDPEFIADMVIKEHLRILSGYFGNPKTDKELLKEAMEPKHVAISLTGEATLYPRLSELIEVFHRRSLTTFLVTRGIRPDVLASLSEEPTQLYISIEAYSKETYNYFNQPVVPNGWELTLKTLEILPSFSSPTVLRITLVKGFNTHEKAIHEFAKIIEIAEPTYVEPKAYMHVGASITRLRREHMPTFSEVMEFSKKLAELTGYYLVTYSVPSRVVLLSRFKKQPFRYGKGCPWGWSKPDEGSEESGEYGKLKHLV
ncbi:MAG: 4-demethylwyosine synthase TYW1 [Thermoprotei archaeon]|nr:MAG: 4-demethylwyosine synthase TYW1 [Thermoprotei archaeon]